MYLSKIIPKRKKIIEFNWCKKDFMEMTDRYREIRNKMKRPNDSCFWCNYKFKNGDIMGLAQPKKGFNKILCQKCADKVLNS